MSECPSVELTDSQTSGSLDRDSESLYRELDQAIASAGPRCELSGRCCRFDEFGHTLFLSDFEAERLFARGLPAGEVPDAGRCPFQVGRICTARDERPLGCRVYFCDPSYQERMLELSERFIRRLKSLAIKHGREWVYRPLQFFVAEYCGTVTDLALTLPHAIPRVQPRNGS